MLVIRALKVKLPVNRATFLKHGKTFTIIKKEPSEFEEAFDINFRPPLLLKNCLPVSIVVSFIDSNGESDSIDLQKEEEKHIFVFNLQESIKISILVGDNFTSSDLVLECQDAKDHEIKHIMTDNMGR